MSRMKKVLLMCTAYVLVAALAIGGTVAYLQDDDSDVNVMTLGNVSIEQIEQEWNADETALQDFTQAKPLYPYVGNLGWENTTDNDGAYRRFTMNNVVDKYVSVKNTGKSDAYVRTIIALEMGDFSYDDLGNIIGVSINKYNGSEFQFIGAWDWTDDFEAEIDGKNYNIMVAVHKDAIEPGETTIPSLLQVYMNKDATNEDCEKIDGNGNNAYDILVFSQAVQAAGFADAETALDAAFGDITTNNHPWAGGVKIPAVVEDAKDLDAALNAGDDVILNANLSFSSSDTTANSGYGATGVSVKGSTLDGAGHSLGINNWGTWDAAVHTTGGTIKNLTINSGMRGIFMGSATEDVYIDNVVIDGTVYTFNSDGGNKNYGVYISNSTLNGWTSHSDVHKEVVYTNCIFGEGSGYAYCRPYGPTTFVGCDFEAGFIVEPLGAVTFENCTIGGVPLTDANIDELVTDTANVTVK